uniref:Uncharacterized protein n=1 Tax=Cereibacter sphaeroides (strain ATCC 17025 / ATH 2.4.3) TaxID=349102 RepID=A4WY29_CERS5
MQSCPSSVSWRWRPWPQGPASLEPPSVAARLLGRPADVIGPVRDRAPVPDLAPAFSLRNSHRDRRLVDIQPDERAVLHAVSPPFSRLGTSPSGATLEGERRGRGHRSGQVTPRSWL